LVSVQSEISICMSWRGLLAKGLSTRDSAYSMKDALDPFLLVLIAVGGWMRQATEHGKRAASAE
jgi:hypothetical protein